VVDPLFLIEAGQALEAGKIFELSGPEAKHAYSVRRLKVGDRILLSNGDGIRARGIISSATSAIIQIEIASLETIPRPKPSIILVQALAKGDRDELAIQAATELGVMRIIPWQASRSVSVWRDEKRTKGQLRWQSIVSEATKQSLRSFVPQVDELTETVGLVKRLEGVDLVLVLDPYSEVSILEVFGAGQPLESIALIVGPEGGIDNSELEAFSNAGYQGVRLGPEVLRTSTAGVAAVSFLQSRVGSWNFKEGNYA
jgi:16S rRNA (uracil1498-N3)-methyltransferase